jgi:murein DD-endopeptidase MepM/ murein hydrolase activator NlpD
MFARVSVASHTMGGGLLRVGAAASGTGIALVGGLVVGLKAAHDAYTESYKVGKQTEAVLKSTGMAAGVTAKQVSALATAISNKTGIDDEAIQSGENLLLTFTQVRDVVGKGNDIFTQATRTMTDMSVALGQDAKSSAIQLGKALNDPIKGVTALQRVGVSFTKDQKEQIKTLVESGKTLDAQKMILRELNREFGGSAEAAATPLERLKVTIGNLQESIGGALEPTLQRGAAALNGFVLKVTPKLNKSIREIGSIWTRKDVFGKSLDLSDKIKLSTASVKRNFGPFAKEIKGEIDRAKLGDKLAVAFDKAVPKVINAVAAAAPRAAGMFIKAFRGAGTWGQIFTVGLLASRMGAFGKLGGMAAGMFGASFQRNVAKNQAIAAGGTAAGNTAASAAGGAFSGAFGGILGAKLPKLAKVLDGAGATLGKAFGLAFKATSGVFIASVIAQIAGIENANPLLFLNPPSAGLDPKTEKERLAQAVRDGKAGIPSVPNPSTLPRLGKTPATTIGDLSKLPQLRSKPWSAPTGGQGKLIGLPGQGTHSRTEGPNNWQSDNAVDISVTRGTPILAVEGGTVTKVSVRPDGSGRFAGSSVTIKGVSGNSYFYAHLSSVSVKAGQKVRGGEQIGASGVANGVPHLHFATEKGDPRTVRVASGGLAVTQLSPQLKTIYAAAKKYGIDPAVLYGVYGQESQFGKNLGPSSAGALGPFQIMPDTAKKLGVDPMNFKEAAYGAARYLSQYKGRGTRGMLAAYNAGPNGNPNNAETRNYITQVLGYSKKFPTLGAGDMPNIDPTDMKALIKTIVTQTVITPIAQRLRRALKPAIADMGHAAAGVQRSDDKLAVLDATEGLVDEDLTSIGGQITRYQELTTRRDALVGRGFAHEQEGRGIAKAIRHYTAAIARLKAQYKKAKPAARPTIKAQIRRYQDRVKELQAEARAMGVTLQIDSAEIKAAMAAITAFGGDVSDAVAAKEEDGRVVEQSGIDRDAALAALTDTPQDDYDAAQKSYGVAQRRFTAAVKSGDADRIAEAARGLKEAGDTLKQAGDTLKDYAADQRESALDAQLIMNQVDTPNDTTDDRATVTEKLGIAEGKYREAKAAGDTEGIKKWGAAVLSLRGDLQSLTDSVAEANRLAQVRVDLDKQLVDNQLKILAMAKQGPEILAAVVAAVSGGIGGKTGLGFQSVGVAGSVARY